MSKSLTKKQKEIFDYIVTFIDDNGFAPSYREIANDFGLSSVATVHDHVKSLVQKGYLILGEDGEARGLEVVEDKKDPVFGSASIPLFGLIAAGEPIEALESSDKVEVPQSMLGSGDYFALQVKGESMIEEGILDGDYVVVEKREVANNGDIVVALLNGRDATLKRFYKEPSQVRLEPANSTMAPIIVKDHLDIQGKVIGLMRRF